MLQINHKKKKIMVFHKRTRKFVDICFKMDTEFIEIVLDYTYQGNRLTPTGKSCSRSLKRKSFTLSLTYENIQSSVDNPKTAFQICVTF